MRSGCSASSVVSMMMPLCRRRRQTRCWRFWRYGHDSTCIPHVSSESVSVWKAAMPTAVPPVQGRGLRQQMAVFILVVFFSLSRQQVMTENVRTNWFCSLVSTLLTSLKCCGSTGWWVSRPCTLLAVSVCASVRVCACMRVCWIALLLWLQYLITFYLLSNKSRFYFIICNFLSIVFGSFILYLVGQCSEWSWKGEDHGKNGSWSRAFQIPLSAPWDWEGRPDQSKD